MFQFIYISFFYNIKGHKQFGVAYLSLLKIVFLYDLNIF